jgi:heme-degrading monooxygenase HmoA
MLVERSYLLIKDGLEDDFAAVMADKAIPLLKGLDGANAVSFGRGVESPDKFMLLIEWQTMDAHTAFTKDPSFAEFRALLAPFTMGGSMEHFAME